MIVTVAALQPSVRVVYGAHGGLHASNMAENLKTACRLIADAAGAGAKVAVLPEFFLTGYTAGRSLADWIDASVALDGPEIAELCDAAKQHRMFLAGAFYESIAVFPGRYFNTAFVADPQGAIIIAYRKLYAMTDKTRPSDVLSRWQAAMPADSLFPVADTQVGVLGAMVARDSHWPEVARCLALRGAEIIVNPCAAMIEADNAGRFARRSRAYENHAAIIAANIGPLVGSDTAHLPQERAPSEILDWNGNVLATARDGLEQIVLADIDLTALRERRLAGNNMVAQLQPAIHARVYADAAATLFPEGRWDARPIADVSENTEQERAAIDRMLSAGMIRRP